MYFGGKSTADSPQARQHVIAAKWAGILIDEFAKQGEMEKDVGIPTALFGGPPQLGSLLELAKSQLNFINVFCRPLFEAVTDVFPAMQFTVDEILANKGVWEAKLDKEKEAASGRLLKPHLEGVHSPRSGSPIRSLQQRESSREGATSTITQSTLSSSQATERQEAAVASQAPQTSTVDPASRPATGTPPQSPDSSRRPSLGSPFTYNVPGYSDVTSRRSSGSFTGTNIVPSSQTRRSSNTVPSQLQLGMDLSSYTTPSAENVPPMQQPGDSRASAEPLQTSDSGVAVTFNGSRPSRGGGGGGSVVRSSSLDTSPTKREGPWRQSTRHPNHPSSGRFSVPSSHDRHSQATSGANTSMSMMTPYSASTEATSFLTVDSDDNTPEKSYDGTYENGRPVSSGMPTVVDVERGGRGGEDVKSRTVMTTVLTNDSGRTISKRPSRFRLDFWKKRGKAQETSP